MNTNRHSPPGRLTHRTFADVALFTNRARKKEYEQVWAALDESV